MTSEYMLIPATAEHHGVSISILSESRARLVRVMLSGRDNGTIGLLTRNYGTLPPERNVTWNHGRACPVPFDDLRAILAQRTSDIEAHWSKTYPVTTA